MISNFVYEVGLNSGVGYVAGYLVGMGNTVRQAHLGGVIGAVSGLALAITRPATHFICSKFNLEDHKVHLIKACTTTLIGAASIAAFVSTGIVGIAGASIIGLIFSFSVLNSLDKAYAKWGNDDCSIINSRNIWLTNV